MAQAAVLNPIGSQVDEIKFLESRVAYFQVHNELDLATALKQLRGFQYQIRTEQEADTAKCTVRIRIAVVVHAVLKGQPEKQAVGELRTDTVFKLKQLPQLLADAAPGELPAALGGTMGGLAYSTARGQLLALGAGTILSRAFLPW